MPRKPRLCTDQQQFLHADERCIDGLRLQKYPMSMYSGISETTIVRRLKQLAKWNGLKRLNGHN